MEQAKSTFSHKYLGKYVNWEGHVMRIDGDERNLLHQATVLMAMNPRDVHPSQDGEREPDLVLTFDYYSFMRNKALLESLHRGDYV